MYQKALGDSFLFGVYVSEDNCDTFVPQMTGMPLGTVVTDLEIDDSPHVLSAGTYSRSAF